MSGLFCCLVLWTSEGGMNSEDNPCLAICKPHQFYSQDDFLQYTGGAVLNLSDMLSSWYLTLCEGDPADLSGAVALAKFICQKNRKINGSNYLLLDSESPDYSGLARRRKPYLVM